MVSLEKRDVNKRKRAKWNEQRYEREKKKKLHTLKYFLSEVAPRKKETDGHDRKSEKKKVIPIRDNSGIL